MPSDSHFLCVCFDVCIQKTVYQKFKLIWFKMHDFSAIYDNQNQTDVFLAEYPRNEL